MARKKIIQFPRSNDPRWFFLAFSLCFNLYALTSPGFHRFISQWLAAISTGLTLDFALHYFLRDTIIFPLSGLLTSLSCVLLCDSPLIWPYAAIAGISIVSKHFLRTPDRTKPIFNPSDFGLVMGLLFLRNFMDVVPGRWGGSLWVMSIVAGLGFLIATRVHRLELCLSWISTFIILSILRSKITGISLVTTLAPMTGASFMLLTFFMITDPMTTPGKLKNRIIFGIALGIIDAILRYFQVINSPFYALFILSALRAAFLPQDDPEMENIYQWRGHEIKA